MKQRVEWCPHGCIFAVALGANKEMREHLSVCPNRNNPVEAAKTIRRKKAI